MSSKDEDDFGLGLPKGDGAYKVGYGKPPKARQFKPGQSGNPKGRPKGSRNSMPKTAVLERLNSLVLEEAYRSIQIRDGATLLKMPALQAALRSLSLQAAQGKQGAQRMLLELVSLVEAENRRNREQTFQTVVEYKCDAQAQIDAARRLGLEEPEILPHPDDLIVDPISGSVVSKGPWTREEKAELDQMREIRTDLQEELKYEQAQPARKRDHERIAALKAVIRRYDEVLNFERVILPLWPSG
jgi:Family of unknown function (DUF5681)